MSSNPGNTAGHSVGIYQIERRSPAEREYDQAVAAASAEYVAALAARGLTRQDYDATLHAQYTAAHEAAWRRLLSVQPDGYH